MKISKNKMLENFYLLLFILIMFSGSTFLAGYVMQMVIILILILFAFARIKGVERKANVSKGNKFYKLIFFSIIVFLISQLRYSYVPKITLVFVERFIVFFLLITYVPKEELLYKTIKAIRFASFPISISIIFMSLITRTKAGGLVGSYQFAGMMMSITFGVLLIDYFFEKNKATSYGLILSLIALLTSGKRTFSFLALLSFFLIYKLNNDKGKVKKVLKITIILLLCFAIAYLSVPTVRLLFERIKSYSGDATYNGRSYYWEAAIKIFKEHRISGIGMGCFSSYFDVFFHRFGNLEAYDAHNIYIQMLSEIGLLGISLFIISFIIPLLYSIKLLKNKKIKENKISMYIMSCSIYLQLWFLIYGFTGNPLYGASQTFLYYSAVAMMFAVRNKYLFGGAKNEKIV